MKRAAALACLPLFACIATASYADDKPLFIYVSPNPIGVNDFLKLGKIGTERVAKELGAEAKTYESSDPTTQRQNLEAAAKAGAKVVIMVGFEFNDMLPEVAAAYPNVQFLQVDSCPFAKMKPNIHCSVFREYEASFLTGAEAALTTKTGKVGAISAQDIPFPASLHRRVHRGRQARQAGRQDFADALGRRQQPVLRSRARGTARRRDGRGRRGSNPRRRRGIERRHLQGGGGRARRLRLRRRRQSVPAGAGGHHGQCGEEDGRRDRTGGQRHHGGVATADRARSA